MDEAILEHTGVDITGMDEAALRGACQRLGIAVEASMGKGKLIDEIFSEKCEGHYIQPTFITDYPVEMSPLTKGHRSRPGLIERDDRAMFIDHDFLRALEYGMPPISGIGFGIDRLCMLHTGQPFIQDVLLFPMMRPEKTS